MLQANCVKGLSVFCAALDMVKTKISRVCSVWMVERQAEAG